MSDNARGFEVSEFERKGHWRNLSDGTRTWVSGHNFIRSKTSILKIYSDQVFKNKKTVFSKTVLVHKKTSVRMQPRQTEADRKAAEEVRKVAQAKRIARRSAKRQRAKSESAEWENDLLRRIALDRGRDAAIQTVRDD